MPKKKPLQIRIGELAARTGRSVHTIRWYEQEGWLPPAARTAGGHRAYGEAHLRRLGFIRHARDLGFESAAIRALLDLADHPEADCGDAHRTEGDTEGRGSNGPSRSGARVERETGTDRRLGPQVAASKNPLNRGLPARASLIVRTRPRKPRRGGHREQHDQQRNTQCAAE